MMSVGANPGILSQEESDAICRRILSLIRLPQAQVEVLSSARATTAFARGDVHTAEEHRYAFARLSVEDASGRRAFAMSTRLDDTGLATLVGEAEALAKEHRTPAGWGVRGPRTFPRGPKIFFDSTLRGMGDEHQSRVFHQATEVAEAAGLVAAGDLSLRAYSQSVLSTSGLTAYQRNTFGEFSLTARTADGRGSGWAWGGYEDWSRVQVESLIDRAVSLARRSANPSAVEPGRYTVILEPAAVAAVLEPLLTEWPARYADSGSTVFAGDRLGTNKIGMQMVDRRLRLVSDPWDPERPASTITGIWSPISEPVTWFEQGVLKNLVYDTRYARQQGQEEVVNPGGLRLEADGPPQSVEEMIASTRRGIWVNRLSHVIVMNRRSLLLTGTTRDGTFLIENGKITRPVKNFRFTESPMFILNRLQAWGEPVRASQQIVAPRLKVGDFNFTSLTDAI